MSGKKERKSIGAVGAVLRGTAAGAVVLLVLMLLAAALISCGVLDLAESRGIGMLIGFLGGLAAGLAAREQGRGRRILMGVTPGIVLCLLLLLLSVLLYEPSTEGRPCATLICILVGGLAASAVRVHRGGKGRRTSRALHRRHKIG